VVARIEACGYQEDTHPSEENGRIEEIHSVARVPSAAADGLVQLTSRNR